MVQFSKNNPPTEAQKDLLRRTPMEAILAKEGKDIRHTPSFLYHSPFREDNTPSFHIDEAHHRFSDPGDNDPAHRLPGRKQAGGDTIHLVKWLKNLDYYGALNYLASFNPSIVVTDSVPAQRGELRSSAALSSYTVKGGGARGADSVWESVGKRYGITSIQYYHGRKTPAGNTLVSEEEFEEGRQHVFQANATLMRRNFEPYMDLLARNWMQVKGSEAVFAVGTINRETSRRLPDGSAYNPVNGGTGWAVQMAIDAKVPVIVFDQEKETWYVYSVASKGGWKELSEAPVLPECFAGVGTRELNPSGEAAIEACYKKTILAKLETSVPNVGKSSTERTEDDFMKEVDQSKSMEIWAGKDGSNRELSNMADRVFVVGGKEFRTVEHWYQYHKALFFHDDESANAILEAKTSWDARLLGRKVKGFDSAAWLPGASAVMETGMRLSFVANPAATNALLKTGNALLTHGHDKGYWGKEMPRLLMKLRHEFKGNIIDEQGEYRGVSEIEIKSFAQGIRSKMLLDYETKQRAIHPDVLQRYCFQVNYVVTTDAGSEKTQMSHMAVGFPNHSGGWALRGTPYTRKDGSECPGVKRSTGNDATFIDKDGTFLMEDISPTSDNVVVFEGFNDFLAWLTCREQLTPGNTDVVVLNSVVNKDRAAEFILGHKTVYGYLDADTTGVRDTKALEDTCKYSGVTFKDCSYFYSKHGENDFNAFWIKRAAALKKDGHVSKLDSAKAEKEGKGTVETPAKSESKSKGRK